MGDPTRLHVLQIISRTGVICVSKIACMLNISQPAVSQHLKVLKNAGLVTAERKGYHVHYSLNEESLGEYKIDIRKLLGTFGDQIIKDHDCSGKKSDCGG
jgi:DNA-binding transcriptional ArsR family regulator